MRDRTISWAAALRDLKADRATRPITREERLRSTAGLRGSPPAALSAWRGVSGRRYVVVVHGFDQPDLVTAHPAVVLAVRRDAESRASPVAVRACETGDSGYLGWLAACAQLGAVEIHVHRLAEGQAERAAIARDLTGPVPAAGVSP
ncbi:hypothetical protein Q8W71_25485 [Methylobacterium sp. NEAU 140]|uniref:hypothetical protein n=1 Tax=Methylobacterium sp. NEAU 140 TaxID=3064945 RepID=UPI002732AB43|nr:hypothetical protein [Methylobacterium sp. NEAU 140]MDP4025990.1 hypothetical protein [Methylobacterium sp. NEAU 140]